MTQRTHELVAGIDRPKVEFDKIDKHRSRLGFRLRVGLVEFEHNVDRRRRSTLRVASFRRWARPGIMLSAPDNLILSSKLCRPRAAPQSSRGHSRVGQSLTLVTG